MSEQITKPFIIIITFVSLSTLLITATGSFSTWAGQQEMDELLEGWETIGGMELTEWAPTVPDPGGGYQVDGDDTQILQHDPYYNPRDLLSVFYNEEDYYYDFPKPYGSGDGIRVWVFRNSTSYEAGGTEWWQVSEDFFLMTRASEKWPHWKIRKAVVPFEDILANQDENRSYAYFKLGQLSNVTLLINCTTNLTTALSINNGYTIRIGTPVGAEIGTVSMWTVLGQLMTLSLPKCDPIVNALLAFPLWAGIGIVAVTIIQRAIGALMGGGG